MQEDKHNKDNSSNRLTIERVEEQLAILGELYNKELSSGLIDLYHLALADEMTQAQFDHAVRHIVKSRKYSSLPTPAEFLDFMKAKAGEDPIEIAHEIEQAMKGASSSRKPKLSLAADNVVALLGGWSHICMMDLRDWHFERKRIPELAKYAVKQHQIAITNARTKVPQNIADLGKAAIANMGKISHANP
jgi:hypothetical protein